MNVEFTGFVEWGSSNRFGGGDQLLLSGVCRSFSSRRISEKTSYSINIEVVPLHKTQSTVIALLPAQES